MYNRYIPQPDGSYRRNRVPEPIHSTPPPSKQEDCPPPPPPECPPEKKECPLKKPHPAPRQDGFLQQLLPKDFDTGDLIVVLLLLLMAGDSEEGRNNALLTLVLYFLM